MNLPAALPLVFTHSPDEVLGAYDMHFQPAQVLVSVLLAVFAASSTETSTWAGWKCMS